MAACTFRDEAQKARRIVRRLDEIAEIEARGETIPQTYFPSPPLQPRQQIYVFVPETPTVVPRTRATLHSKAPPKTRGKSPVATTPAATPDTTLDWSSLSASPTHNPATTLLSPHMKSTLSFLRNQLLSNPEKLPPLDTLATRFDHPSLCDDQTLREREKFESCETRYLIEKWWTWCDEKSDKIVEVHGKVRIATCLAHCIRLWQEQVWYEEQSGSEVVGESFLSYTMGRLEDLEGIDEEVEDELRSYDRDASEAQLEQTIEKSCLDEL
jgi:hypothetical protein